MLARSLSPSLSLLSLPSPLPSSFYSLTWKEHLSFLPHIVSWDSQSSTQAEHIIIVFSCPHPTTSAFTYVNHEDHRSCCPQPPTFEMKAAPSLKCRIATILFLNSSSSFPSCHSSLSPGMSNIIIIIKQVEMWAQV